MHRLDQSEEIMTRHEQHSLPDENVPRTSPRAARFRTSQTGSGLGLRSLIAMSVLLFATALSCSDDDGYNKFPMGDASIKHGDGGPDAQQDATVLPDRITNPDGPNIVILKPATNALVSGDQMEVEARISDDDSEVDPSSVKVYVTATESSPLSRQSAGSDLYTGIVSISALGDGQQIVVVEAADLFGNVNSAETVFLRDTGPTITFYSPQDQERYAHGVNLSFEVRDKDGVRGDSVTASIGSVQLNIAKTGQDDADPPTWMTYSYNIVFSDQIFSPPLEGPQMIQVQAQNLNNTKSTASLNFVVDEQGPTITVQAPEPGDIVGGILSLVVSVDDEAGVMETSVVAVLAGDQLSYTIPLTRSGGSFGALFDTRVFPDNFIFPSISIRAADSLGNESSIGFLVALDNQPPKISLDPPDDFRLASKNEQGLEECSREFDPVGSDAANWGETVPQAFWLRARIEDQGNKAAGLVQERLALVNYDSVKLYVLDDTSQPLVVDTDGDGYCDDINPLLNPSTTPQSSQEVLVLNMTPIPPTGDANFIPEQNPVLPLGCDLTGTSSDTPSDLCAVTPMTVSLFYTLDPQEPAIYSLEPVTPNDSLFCSGQQFDALANHISEGWACAAVRAKDRLGNIGISQPLPICIDYTMDGNPSECQSSPSLDICLGTQDPNTLEVTNTPCQFDLEKQVFRARKVREKQGS